MEEVHNIVQDVVIKTIPKKINAIRQNDWILKEELLRSVGAQYAIGDQWRNNSRKNEGMEPKQNTTQLWM